MCYYWDYSTGQTTDPKFVAAIIKIIRDHSPNAKISIVESDASAMKCKYAFRFLGYESLAQTQNAFLINLSEDKSEKVEIKVRDSNFDFMMPQTIKNADLRINVPKIKYLVPTKISCALKNVFGCNPNPNKFQYHPRLDETIVALNKIMRFHVSILDGVIVSGIRTVKLGGIMASQDPVALDAAAARMTGVNPKSIRHIVLAHKEGLGSVSFVPKGADPKHFDRRYPRMRLTQKILQSGYRFAKWTGLLDEEML